jgi:ketosteroid isomerase-like protein
MKLRYVLPISLLLFTVCAFIATKTRAQSVKPPADPELFHIIEAQDAALFDAYNRCDLDKFGSLIDENVEFYHDNGGLTLGRKALVDSIKQNICGQTQRQLVPGTLEVFGIHHYGALEIGVHRFTHPNAKPPVPDGEGRFVHLWHYDNATTTWKVTRVFSFDHHELAK